MPLVKNDVIPLVITALSNDGSGVGRAPDGLAVFVPFTAVGDALTVSATWFDRKTRNQIDFNSCAFPTSTDPLCVTPGTTDPRFGYYLNLDRTRARGIEATAALVACPDRSRKRTSDRIPASVRASEAAAMPSLRRRARKAR